MQTNDCIMQRRSVRSYTEQTIPEETLKRILDAALMAPSAVNLQPWYFVAVQSPAAMESLLQVMAEVSARQEPFLKERFAAHLEVAEETSRFIRKLGNAPVCVLAFERKPDYQDHLHHGILLSIAAAIENMLLAATDLGVSSCWLTAPQEAGLGEVLRQRFAPDKGPLVSVIALGYGKTVPSAPRRKDGCYTIL